MQYCLQITMFIINIEQLYLFKKCKIPNKLLEQPVFVYIDFVLVEMAEVESNLFIASSTKRKKQYYRLHNHKFLCFKYIKVFASSSVASIQLSYMFSFRKLKIIYFIFFSIIIFKNDIQLKLNKLCPINFTVKYNIVL